MIYIVQNAGAIVLAALAGLAISFVYHRVGGNEQRLDFGLVATALAANVVIAAILAGALILAPVKVDPWIIAVVTATVIWAGFVAPAIVATLRYHGVATGSVTRYASHWLVAMVVEAVVLHTVGLSAPVA